MNERVNKVIDWLLYEKKAHNGAEIARLIGVTTPTFSRMRHNERNFRNGDVAKICEKFPELNSEWICTGIGEMLKQAPTQQINGNNNNVTNSSITTSEEMTQLIETIKEQTEIIKALTETIKNITAKHQ